MLTVGSARMWVIEWNASGRSQTLNIGSYIPTSQNPADVTTRSVPAEQVLNTSWLTRPKFQKLPTKKDAPVDISYDLIDSESGVEDWSYLTACTNTNLGSLRFEEFSTWQSFIRTIATLIHIAWTTIAITLKHRTQNVKDGIDVWKPTDLTICSK